MESPSDHIQSRLLYATSIEGYFKYWAAGRNHAKALAAIDVLEGRRWQGETFPVGFADRDHLLAEIKILRSRIQASERRVTELENWIRDLEFENFQAWELVALGRSRLEEAS